MIPTAAIIATAILFGAALVLLAVVSRGRRTDDHPICRRCGFDLFGKPADSTRCSECGADLNRKRATRVGNYEPRRGWVAVSLLVLIVSGVPCGLGVWQKSQTFVWIEHKPVWWLKRDLDSANPTRRDASINEFTRRMNAGQLPDNLIADLVARGMALQADASRPWVPPWGVLIEAARGKGKLRPEQWQIYLAQGVTFQIETLGGDVERGEPVVVRLLRGPDRSGPYPHDVQVTFGEQNLTIDGVPAKTRIDRSPLNYGGFLTLPVPSTPTAWPVGTPLHRLLIETQDLPPGERSLSWRIEVRPQNDTTGFISSLAIALFADRDFGKVEPRATSQFTLLKSTYDPNRRAKLASWLSTAKCDSIYVSAADDSYPTTSAAIRWPEPPPSFVKIQLSLAELDGSDGSLGEDEVWPHDNPAQVTVTTFSDNRNQVESLHRVERTEVKIRATDAQDRQPFEYVLKNVKVLRPDRKKPAEDESDCP